MTLILALERVQDAAENSRLASNTYKRLNLGLLAAGLTVLLNKRTAEAIWLATKVDIPSGFFYATSVFTLMSILTMFCFTEAEEATLAQTPTGASLSVTTSVYIESSARA
eukprot:gene25728-31467_t